MTNITAISAGAYHSLALVNTGPVTFLKQPYSQIIYKGSDTSFSAPVLGAAPMSYQWVQNGTSIVSATNTSLAITNAQLTNAGNYQLVVSNSYGAVTSAVAVLTVNDPAPSFTLQPTNRWVLQNSNATLTASVVGLPPFTYQWLLNGAAIPWATNTTITVTNAQPTNEGNYSLAASNAYGTATSSNAFLNVVDVPEALGPTNLTWVNSSQPPWFAESNTTHDGFAAAAAGQSSGSYQSVLQTTVTGPGTLSFWWADSGSAALIFSVDGPTLATLRQSGLSWTNPTFYLASGVHVLTWTASSAFGGMAYLDQVTYTPGPTPVFITTQPASQTNAAGNNVTLSVGATGSPPLNYQWYFNGATISGATASSVTVANIQASNIGTYYVVVTNSCCMAVSSNAVLGVTPSAPTITTQPANAQAMLGGQATFTSAAIGSSPINYQWLFNASPISSATNLSLTVSNVQYTNGGNYAMVASNAIGATVSSNTVLLAYTIADLAAALNNPQITWSMANVPWFPETNTTHSGISAAQSGAISGSQQSTLQGVVTGPATVTFWWMVSCNSMWDNLAFSVNGTIQNSIAGTVNWQQVTNYLGAGSQTLQWNLYPFYPAYAGGTGWLDQVQVIPGGTAAIITANPAKHHHHRRQQCVLLRQRHRHSAVPLSMAI